MLNELLHTKVQEYIKNKEHADLGQLLLQGVAIEGVEAKQLAIQISGRSKAKLKLPIWYHTDDIIYPAKISMEQCSSEQTARYKSSIVKGTSMVDLTGGAGVDTYYFSQKYPETTYIEQNTELLKVSQHNFSLLGSSHIAVHNVKAEDYIASSENKFDLIYIDPARRDELQKKVFRFADCTPNVSALMPMLLERGRQIMIKTAPFLDIKHALQELVAVREVHVVAVKNECKEVLYLLSTDAQPKSSITIHTVNLMNEEHAQLFSFEMEEEKGVLMNYTLPERYLYEPNVAILKSGGINSLGEKYNLSKLNPNTQLFSSDKLIEEFPGRIFECVEVLKYDKKSVKKAVPFGKANITTRNFPDSVAQIRKRTGLKDGGDEYLFATTNKFNEKIILRTKKLDKPMG